MAGTAPTDVHFTRTRRGPVHCCVWLCHRHRLSPSDTSHPMPAMPNPIQPTQAGTSLIQLSTISTKPTIQTSSQASRSFEGGNFCVTTNRSPHSGQVFDVIAVRLYPHMGHCRPVSDC